MEMTYFAVEYTYTNDADALAAERPAHRDYLRTLGAGGMLAAGLYPDADVPGALLLFRCNDAREVETMLDKDPYWVKRLIVDRRIKKWTPTIGVFENQ